MAAKPAGPLGHLMPVQLSGSHEIENQEVKLTIDTKTVIGSGGVYRAQLLYMGGHTESCVAVRKRTSVAFDTFTVLKACSHQNIAKPIGLWEDKEKQESYIVFQNFDGVLSSVPKEAIFEVENLLEPNPAIYGFSKIGFGIIWDIMSAVNYVNDHYQQETTQIGNYIPLKSLRIEAGTIFYQLKEDQDYQVLLSDFEIDTGGSSQKSSQKVKGRKGGNRWKPKAASSGEEPDIQKISTRNWNNTGKYISQLYGTWRPNFEITHLVDRLKEEAVKYDDLVWEAGLWDLSTKIYFIREIFWCYDTDTARKGEILRRGALGLQSCINTLNVMETIDKDTVNERTQIIDEKDLFKSLVFLRVFLLAHQADVVKRQSDQAGIQNQKSAERFVLEQKGDYMVRLSKEMRDLNWIKTSPYLRSRHDYMIERHHPQEKK